MKFKKAKKKTKKEIKKEESTSQEISVTKEIDVLEFSRDIFLTKKLIEKIYVSLGYFTRELTGLLIGEREQERVILSDIIFLPQEGSFGGVSLKEGVISDFMAENIDFFEKNPSIELLGWWHTHPNMSPSQSNTDINNNKNLIQYFLSTKQTKIMFSLISGSKSLEYQSSFLSRLFGEVAPAFGAPQVLLKLYVFGAVEGYYFCEEITEKIRIFPGVPYTLDDISDSTITDLINEIEKFSKEKEIEVGTYRSEYFFNECPLASTCRNFSPPSFYDKTKDTTYTVEGECTLSEECGKEKIFFIG